MFLSASALQKQRITPRHSSNRRPS